MSGTCAVSKMRSGLSWTSSDFSVLCSSFLIAIIRDYHGPLEIVRTLEYEQFRTVLVGHALLRVGCHTCLSDTERLRV